MSDLSLEQKKFIKKKLSFTPEEEFRKSNHYSSSPESHSIEFYVTEGDNIKLPLLFAASTYQLIPNSHKIFPNSKIDFTGTLRNAQTEVATIAIDHLTRFGTTTLNLYTGFGKTIMGAYLSAYLKKITLVICNREILLTQWKGSFESTTKSIIFIVGEKNEVKIENADIILCMNTRIKKVPADILNNIGTVIFDEAHLLCTQGNVEMLLATQPYYVIVLTATLQRTDSMDVMMRAIAGSHEIVRKMEKHINVIKLTTNTEIEDIPKQANGDTNFSALQNLIFSNERRNNIICSLAVNSYKDEYILILTKYTEHATNLGKMLKSYNVDCDTLFGTKKTYNECRVLIGTVSKIGTGFDQQNSCKGFSGKRFRVLFLVCSIKKKQTLIQALGRVTRADNPIIVHFVDSVAIIKRHYGEAKKLYKEMEATIHNLDVPV